MSTSSSTNIKIKADTHRSLKIAASVMDKKMQDLVDDVLSKWIKDWENIYSGKTQIDARNLERESMTGERQ